MTSSAQNSKQVLAQQGSATVPAYSFLGDQDTGVYRSGSNEVSVSTNGTQRAVVTSAGNVGIGTSSPASKLAVSDGTVVIDTSPYTAGSAGYFGCSTNHSLAIITNNAERMRITSAGKVGIGTTTPAENFSVVGGADTWSASFLGLSSSNVVKIGTLSGVAAIGANNNAGSAWADLSINQGGNVYISSGGGNVGIGTTSPSSLLHVAGTLTTGAAINTGSGVSTGDATIDVGGLRTGNGNAFVDLHAVSGTDYEARVLRNSGTNGNFSVVNTGTGSFDLTQAGAGVLLLQTSNTERVRVHSGGDVSVSSSNASIAVGVGMKFLTTGACGSVMDDGASATNSYHLYNENATNNGFRFYVNTNGGIYNFSANNYNLSDERVKKDIEPAGSYLEKLCAIPVRTFRYKDQEGDWKNIGVIAQEVEAVAPEFVGEDETLGNSEVGEKPLKGVYDTDIMYAMMKALQELKIEVDKLKGTIK